MGDDIKDRIFSSLAGGLDPNDPVSVARWTERLSSALIYIRVDIKGLSATLKEHMAADSARAMKLERISSRLDRVENDIDDNRKDIDGIVEALREKLNVDPDDNGNEITFKWLTENILLPFVTSVVAAAMTAYILVQILISQSTTLHLP